MEKILIVDDDPDIREIISLYLKRARYQVKTAESGERALESVNMDDFSLIILDIMLPGIDGVELCERLRREIFCPIIFISVIDKEEYILRAFKKGGDDYLVKPFRYEELVVRIRANIRRFKLYNQDFKQRFIEVGGLIVDQEKHLLIREEKRVYLSPTEFKILIFMINNKNRTLSYEEIFNNIWEEENIGDYRSVKVHVSNLRKKLEQNPGCPVYIQNVWGTGYIFQPE